MRARNIWRLRVLTLVTVVSAGLGTAFATRYDATPTGLATGFVTGGLSGLVLASLEMVLQGPGTTTLRRLPVGFALALRTLVYGVVFVGAARSAAAMLHVLSGQSAQGERGLNAQDLLLSFAVALAINFVLVLRRLLGPRTLVALVTGRYHRPREEERVVLFLDLRGSTPLAEQLGDRDFHRFLNRVFYDITDPVLEAGGEIYRYVGDEIIVTWPFEQGTRDGACLTCVFAIEDALTRRQPDYIREFGAEPRLRGALHAGSLIVGEMGDLKREIVMLGDTMNTAARIEEACRTMGRDYIVSGTLFRAVTPLPPGVRADSLGTLPLRGKEQDIELFALSRQ